MGVESYNGCSGLYLDHEGTRVMARELVGTSEWCSGGDSVLTAADGLGVCLHRTVYLLDVVL